MATIGVKVMPREVILDTQGRAVEQTLARGGSGGVKVRVGKFIELEVEGDEATAMTRAKQIADSVLHNPLIETYTLETVKK
ncbi:MAG: phosphoribosylformylglycinamidine synthase subunit PurS [Bdellovibrionaceae bacterium]|nr:phosphoribosylformylglycinamidine synthase subunit PurS [Pseudobdellovibrionaceae bacterium]